MAVELFNSRLNDYDEIEVDFLDLGSNTSGSIAVHLDPNEHGRYPVEFTLNFPIPFKRIFSNTSRESSIDLLDDDERLDHCVKIVLKSAMEVAEYST